jgi:hypothetical protein
MEYTMTMQTIQLDISSDIFDKVMSFLEILPKNKVRVTTNLLSKKSQQQKNSLTDFFQSSPLVGLEFERKQESYSGRIEF